MRVLYHYDAGDRLRARLDALAADGLDISICSERDDARLFELLPSTEVLWHCLRPVDAEVLAAAPHLRLVQKIGVGVNTIDLDTARERGVAVCNMPGTNSQAVAEHSLAMMLAVLRRLRSFDGLVRSGRGWDRDPQLEDRLFELGGRRVGLVGYGAVPRILAPVLTALGAEVLYTATAEKADAVGRFLPLEELLAEADVVSLHLPLGPDTAHLLDARRIALMKPGAILVNTARGGLVDTAALCEALDAGHLAGAGLDVFETEPIAHADPLLHRVDVLLAPHVAWLTQETLARSMTVAAENCRRLASGEPLLHRIV
ncbi:MAG TPA: 2-hydroxyacid dehydrogenase [Pseudomonadales bacterium]|nr:2-hydroxyacid dehydrogenase [Pseudomonadales bacterium]